MIALALHVGGAALAIVHLQTEEADDALGASAIEVGLELASVRREVTDLPPGPDTDASAASPQLSEQKAEVKETELPQDKPTETEEADRVVTQNESKKPKEDDPKIAAVQTSASTESVAAEATATPSSEAIPEGPRSVAPVIGTGESARRARATWQKELVAHLDKHKRYPKERAAKIRRDPDSLHARPHGPRALDRYRKRLGRYGLRRGRAGDGAALRSGAGAAAVDRRRRPDLHLAGDLPRQDQELTRRHSRYIG